jgi:opacity protein-like surface antigen
MSDATADMSWSAMVGVNFALNQRIDLNLGLKYQNYGDIDMTNGDGTHTTTETHHDNAT